jgi:hypothetical protein
MASGFSSIGARTESFDECDDAELIAFFEVFDIVLGMIPHWQLSKPHLQFEGRAT